MLERTWRQRTARMILVVFGASSMGCGGSPPEPATSTTTVPMVSTTVAPPTTALLSNVPEALTAAEIRKLVAPIALYPDVVLASLLPATAYPEQLGEAAQWIDERGGTIDAVPEERGWDGSVAGLLQFPDVLTWAHQNEPWTEEMGSAMTYQQGDVLDGIQGYRAEVAKVGNLESNAYQKVVHADDEIRIEPAKDDTVYVPEYDPVAATQPQPEGQALNPWIVFGGGVVVGALGAWALYSIFNDDDDDDDVVRRRRRRRVRRVDDYYYRGRPRPRAQVWTPQQRSKTTRRRRAEAFEPKPLRRAAQADRRRDETERRRDGLRPPGKRDGAKTQGTKRQGAGNEKKPKQNGGKKKKPNAQPKREKGGENEGQQQKPGQGNR